jgi:hypothetical protein
MRAGPPVVASFHIPKLWGFAPAVVVTMASWCGPSPGEGLVRVVRLMLAHGRVVVTMLERRSVPSERDRWCSEPVNDPLTTRGNFAAVIGGRCPSW